MNTFDTCNLLTRSRLVLLLSAITGAKTNSIGWAIVAGLGADFILQQFGVTNPGEITTVQTAAGPVQVQAPQAAPGLDVQGLAGALMGIAGGL